MNIRKIIIINLVFFIKPIGHCQVAELLGLTWANKLEFISDKLNKRVENNSYFYECDSKEISLCYYPQQDGVECGYFVVNDEIIAIIDKFESNLACDFDYGSIKLYKTTIGKESIYILNSIINGSGTATRKVYHNLFVFRENKFLKYIPLWGIFSDENNFGDFNNDGKLDFLEVRYNKFDPNYKLTFTTLKEDLFF